MEDVRFFPTSVEYSAKCRFYKRFVSSKSRKVVPCRPFMKKLITSILVLMSIGLQAQILPTFGNSRTGGSGMQFLKIPVDARSMGMAGVGAGIANDASAMFWNGAGITGIDTCKMHIQVSNTSYFAGNKLNYLGVVFKPGKYGYLGLSLTSMTYADMMETTEFQPDGTGRKINVSDFLLGFTYAKILTESFSFGVTGKWAHEGLGDVSTDNILFDLGLMYNIGIKGSRFGVSFSNFGMNVSPSGQVTILKLNGLQTVNSFTDVSAPAAFRFGAAFDPYNKGFHKITLAAQLTHPTDNNETFAVGAEYSLKNILFVRSGWEFGADESYSIPPLGMGVKIPFNKYPLSIDYGFCGKNRLGNMNRITLSFSIR